MSEYIQAICIWLERERARRIPSESEGPEPLISFEEVELLKEELVTARARVEQLEQGIRTAIEGLEVPRADLGVISEGPTLESLT
jgi:hypothetical protein